MRFAVYFREPNVAKFQSQITSNQFNELIAYWKLEPFGDIRDDERAKMVAQTIANFSAVTKKAFKRKEFQVIDEEKSRRVKKPLIDRWKAFVNLYGASQNGNNSKPSREV